MINLITLYSTYVCGYGFACSHLSHFSSAFLHTHTHTHTDVYSLVPSFSMFNNNNNMCRKTLKKKLGGPGDEATHTHTHTHTHTLSLSHSLTHTHTCHIISGDPDMLWQSYQQAIHRKELDVARERITTYFRLWVEAGEKSIVPSPEISKEFNRFGLLSCPQA